MDKIILGILMLHRMTSYEIRMVIKNNFKSMCSDSLGSIQAALKKLLELEMITYEEVVEKGVNKKRYSIIDKGQEALIAWIKIPIDTSKTKNIDFGKLLFMGLVSKEEQRELLDQVILSLEQEYMNLKALKASIPVEEERKAQENYLLSDAEYSDRIRKLSDHNDISDHIQEISIFTMATLEYGLELAAFNLEWFKKLREKIEKKYEWK